MKEKKVTKEYRIVATVDTEHGDGQKNHSEEAFPWADGRPFIHHPYKDKSEALRVCKVLRKECKEFDKKTKQNFRQNPRMYIAYTQTDIRVQVREVTEWTDAE